MQDDIFPVATLPVAVEAVPPGAMEGGNALRRMQDSHGFATAIAVQRPRSLAEVDKRVQEEARLLGDRAYYGWGAGKDKVEGPSIELAMVLARNWGNAVVDTLPMQETETAWIFTSAFIDLETGFTLSRQFRQAKNWTVYGKLDAARKDDIRFQIGQSKSARNVVLNALPKWLTDKALATAKAGVREGIERFIEKHSIEDARKAVLKALAKETVKEDRVLAKMGREAVGGLTIEDLVILRGNLAALQDGADSADSLFPRPEGEPTGDLRERLTDKTKVTPKGKKPKPESTAPAPEPPATEDEAPPDDPEFLRETCRRAFKAIPPAELSGALATAGITRRDDINAIDDCGKLRKINEVFAGYAPE